MSNSPNSTATPTLQLWGGVECSHVRVGDRYVNQLELSGHKARLDDLGAFAAMGITTLRMPILWEQVWPVENLHPDWAWPDSAMSRLQTLGIDPIVGLLHHGSGPIGTNLLDVCLPERLAKYAAKVATRYPWARMYTPVNEPLTTARFAGLYGLWYPHAETDAAFVRALLVQTRATQLAMQAIRQVNPEAILVQTEDLGYTQSTPALAYQARFENHRRWLSMDLLCGKVVPGHPLYGYLLEHGATADELASIAANPCPPGIIGANYYITSERYLDERLQRYPDHTHGGNGRDSYADVETCRSHVPRIGLSALLCQAWERYGIPIAVTEAHLGCTPEEQMRWLYQQWQACLDARVRGADVRALTAWALLGSYDWDSLLTQPRGHYECGAFELVQGRRTTTAISNLLKALATGQPVNALAKQPGWWDGHSKREENEIEDFYIMSSLPPPPLRRERGRGAGGVRVRSLLILGATGTLGQALARTCEARGLAYVLLSRQECDITDTKSIEADLTRYNPWAVINAAGYVRLDAAQTDRAACMEANAYGPARLAKACTVRGMGLVCFSSDQVFDGRKGAAYVEADAPNPLNVYGESKAEMERLVLAAYPHALVVRTAAFFSADDEHNFIAHTLRQLEAGLPLQVPDDEYVSPTHVKDLCEATLTHLINGRQGIMHVANTGCHSWAELAFCVAQAAGLDTELILPVPSASLRRPARRPERVELASTLTRPLADGLATVAHVAKALHAQMREERVAA